MWPVNVNVAVLPFGIGSRLHVVVAAGTPQLNVGPLVCMKLTNVIAVPAGVPVGSVSVHWTCPASFGPPFVTVIV